MNASSYCVTLTCSDPVPLPEAAFAVIVTVPVVPPRVPVPVVLLLVLMLMMLESSELQLAATLDVKLTVVPAVAMLMVFPEVQELQVIVIVVAPTVILAVPVKPLLVAVIVAGVVVAATPVTTPVELTETCCVSELVQFEDPVTFFGVELSSKVALAVSCWLPATWRLSVLGETVTPFCLALTKKPRHPTIPKVTRLNTLVSTNHLRLALNIIMKTSGPGRLGEATLGKL
jgi:hypothetical protein